jgi:hypothetical protein
MLFELMGFFVTALKFLNKYDSNSNKYSASFSELWTCRAKNPGSICKLHGPGMDKNIQKEAA